MSIYGRNGRKRIIVRSQHLYSHSLSEFAYSNPAIPEATNVELAMNYILAVLYPKTQPAVDTPADLPSTGNDINDYRVVLDDGDGKQAAYRWEQREGDVAPQWYKVMDMDWSSDSILAQLVDVTQPLYMSKGGITDIDENGDPITGLYAGQTIFGGDAANQNLTLNANSGDGVGSQSGYVQVDGNFRPTLDATYDLSNLTERWRDGYFSRNLIINTMTVGTGLITDSTGQISFADENLITTGNFSGAQVKGTSLVADDTTNTMTLVPGNITDSSGQILFGAANLATTGTFGAGVATFTDNTQTIILSPDVSGQANITSSTGTINFVDENLITTGSLDVGALTTDLLDVDNIRIDGNTISSTDVNGNIVLAPNGTGIIDLQKGLQALAATFTGVVGVTGQLNSDNLRLDGNTLSSTDANGNVILSPDGTGIIQVDKSVVPNVGTLDLGTSSNLFQNLYLSGGINDGTNSISVGNLLSFRHSFFRDIAQTQPAQTGDALFYDDANDVWLASIPDSEVTHSALTGLTVGDSGHTQFAMLAGRTGGQIIQGGTDSGNNLTLESTAHATKGSIFLRDKLSPETNASFSTFWSGIDLGDPTHNYNDVYTKGEFKGFRLENFTSGTLPAASGQNIGRVVYASDNNKAYVDTGTAFKVLGVSKFISDISFDGVVLVLNTDVSSEISDARNAQWQLLDNANDFEILGVQITMTSASNVRITTSIPLPVGSYRLIGIE